jgi:hypothetical protein
VKFKQGTIGLLILVCVLFVLLYLPALPERFLLLDDNSYVNIPQYSSMSLASIKTIFTPGYHIDYYPLRDLTYLLDIKVFGGSPMAFRIQNLFWALGSFVFLFLLFVELELSIYWSLFLSSFWLLSPYHAETFLWISARKDVLAIFFAISSCLFGVKFWKSSKVHQGILSIFFFLCCLLSKASFGLLPAALLFVWTIKNYRDVLNHKYRKIILFLFTLTTLGLVSGFFQKWFYSNVTDTRLYAVNNAQFSSSAAAFAKMFVGILVPSVNILDIENWGEWPILNSVWVYPGIFLWTAFIFMGLFAFFKRKWNLLLFIGLFAAAYIPISGLMLPVRQYYSVRYFEPSFLILVLFGGIYSFRYLRSKSKARLMIFGLSLLTWNICWSFKEATIWSDPVEITKKAVEQSPMSTSLHIFHLVELRHFVHVEKPTNETLSILRNEGDFIAKKCFVNGVPKEPNPNGDNCWSFYSQEYQNYFQLDPPKGDMYYKAFYKSYGPINPRMFKKYELRNALIRGKISPKILKEWRDANFYPSEIESRMQAWAVSCYLDGPETAQKLLNNFESKNLISKNDIANLSYSKPVVEKLKGCIPTD